MGKGESLTQCICLILGYKFTYLYFISHVSINATPDRLKVGKTGKGSFDGNSTKLCRLSQTSSLISFQYSENVPFTLCSLSEVVFSGNQVLHRFGT